MLREMKVLIVCMLRRYSVFAFFCFYVIVCPTIVSLGAMLVEHLLKPDVFLLDVRTLDESPRGKGRRGLGKRQPMAKYI